MEKKNLKLCQLRRRSSQRDASGCLSSFACWSTSTCLYASSSQASHCWQSQHGSPSTTLTLLTRIGAGCASFGRDQVTTNAHISLIKMKWTRRQKDWRSYSASWRRSPYASSLFLRVHFWSSFRTVAYLQQIWPWAWNFLCSSRTFSYYVQKWNGMWCSAMMSLTLIRNQSFTCITNMTTT